MIAGTTFTGQQLPATIVAPDNRARVLGVDAERGAPAGSMDITKRNAIYLSRVIGDAFQISDDATNWTTVHTVAGASKGFTFSFDQNMRPAVAYQLGDDATSPSQRAGFLYWFDNAIPGFTTLSLGSCVSPFLYFDFPTDAAAAFSEMLVFYVRDNVVYYRRQSDRFTIEYTAAPMPAGKTRITGVGIGTNWRLQVRCGR